MHRAFTQPWADAFCAAINASDEFRRSARGWSWPVALVMTRHPALGWDDDVGVELQLASGACKGATAVAAEEVTAPYVLRAEYATWKRLARGELDPVSALMRGHLALARGSIAALLMHATAAAAIVDCARAVPTIFPDDAPHTAASA